MSVVEIRTAHLVDDPGQRSLLDPTELERASRRPDPGSFVAAHAFLRAVVGELLGVDPAAVRFERRCPNCGSDQHGKPRIRGHEGLNMSLSYTDRFAIVAVARDGEVGVDVEELEKTDFAGFEDITLARAEVEAFSGYAGRSLFAARARVWARKEAVLKATGHGLVVDPREVVVSGPDMAPVLVAWRSTWAPPGRVGLADVPLDDQDMRAAVALLGTDEVVLVA